MKHLIATLVIIFTFFSLSNAEQDLMKALSNPKTLKAIIRKDIKQLKRSKQFDMSTSTGERIGAIEHVTADRITNAVYASRYINADIQADGSVRYVHSAYGLNIRFRVLNSKYEVDCPNIAYNSTSVVECYVRDEEFYHFRRSFKINYSFILEVVDTIKKLQYHNEQTLIERRNGFIDADEITNFLLSSSK